jgi:hypothetical protein
MTVSKGHAMLKKALLKLVGPADNEDGIALVTSLMLTLITLTIIVSLLYMVTGSIDRSAANKRYKTALEASYGGANIAMKDVIPLIFQNYSIPVTAFQNAVNGSYATSGLVVLPSSTQQWQQWQHCLDIKLKNATAKWGTCSSTMNPTSSPDFQLALPAQGTNKASFSVYSKIVDTIPGNTDVSGVQLIGSGVTEAQSVVNPQHLPYVYRIETVAVRSTNAAEKSSVSVLYAY